MDYGYWIRSFQIHYLRAKGFLGMLYHGLCHRNIHKLFTGIIFYDMDAYYFSRMKHIFLQVDVVTPPTAKS